MTEYIVVLAQIEDALRAVLEFYHRHGVSWGWSIVLLTFTVRLLILPLTLRQFRSMAAMQQLQPKIKQLQSRYAGKKSPEDRKQMQEEVMKLYKEHNVNPFASCLPLVVQMPVFIGLFQVLRHLHPTGSRSFLGIADIFVNLGTVGGTTEVIFVVLYLSSMLGSTLLFSFVADKQQRYMFAGMSVFFVYFIINVPIGVGIYWITTNLWTIAQQGIIKQTMGHHLPHLQKAPKGDAAGAAAATGSSAPRPPRSSQRPKSGGGSGSRKAKRRR